MGDWPWPLSAIEDWMKDFRGRVFDRIMHKGEGIDTWIGRIWSIVDDRLHHKGEGIDTWLGRIYDNFTDYLTREGRGIDSWIGDIHNGIIEFYEGIAADVSSTRQAILNGLTNVANQVEQAINDLDFSVDTAAIPTAVVDLLIGEVNKGLTLLKEALEE